MNEPEFRIERDSMGELKVPKNALYGAQTQRAIDNFPLSGRRFGAKFIQAVASIKCAAAKANLSLGLLDEKIAQAIEQAATEICQGQHSDAFPIDVLQTGSGTSTNMNLNEVIATLASRYLGQTVHPNDHVNMSQSSNDVIPSAIHLSASLMCQNELLPSLSYLRDGLVEKATLWQDIVKTGRTHLMDAMPLSLGQEISAWVRQIDNNIDRVKSCLHRLSHLALGGTAVGTGINAHPQFAGLACNALKSICQIKVSPSSNYFESLSSQDNALELSGQLKVIACSLIKMSNDLRWMNSGPLSGLSEIALPAIQPGSSIMPGKVNPVIPEAICMLAAEVIGNDLSISIAAQSGNFQLNTMLPIIADKLLSSLHLLSQGLRVLQDKAIAGISINQAHLSEKLDKNPILITALNRVIGYELGAKIAKKAYQEQQPILDVAKAMTDLPEAELTKLLDPKLLILGGLA